MGSSKTAVVYVAGKIKHHFFIQITGNFTVKQIKLNL